MPILPGETTLNAATVLAQTGQLTLWLVVLSGAVSVILTCVASTALISAAIWVQGRWQGRHPVKTTRCRAQLTVNG